MTLEWWEYALIGGIAVIYIVAGLSFYGIIRTIIYWMKED